MYAAAKQLLKAFQIHSQLIRWKFPGSEFKHNIKKNWNAHPNKLPIPFPPSSKLCLCIPTRQSLNLFGLSRWYGCENRYHIESRKMQIFRHWFKVELRCMQWLHGRRKHDNMHDYTSLTILSLSLFGTGRLKWNPWNTYKKKTNTLVWGTVHYMAQGYTRVNTQNSRFTKSKLILFPSPPRNDRWVCGQPCHRDNVNPLRSHTKHNMCTFPYTYVCEKLTKRYRGNAWLVPWTFGLSNCEPQTRSVFVLLRVVWICCLIVFRRGFRSPK